jgi:hypothetical protein
MHQGWTTATDRSHKTMTEETKERTACVFDGKEGRPATDLPPAAPKRQALNSSRW